MPFSDDEFLAVYAVVGASEGWEKSVSRVTNEWRVSAINSLSFLIVNISPRMSHALSCGNVKHRR